MAQFIDITGHKYNRLTVVGKSSKKGSRIYWDCKCECGNSVTTTGNRLRRGVTKSCGCFQADMNRLKHGKPKGQREANIMYNRYLSSSRYRKLEFDLSREYFREHLYDECFYCDSTKKLNGYDRIDSSKGYIEGNIVSCCPVCNRAKSDMSFDEFLEYLDGIHAIKDKPSDLLKEKLTAKT